mmetsp:Transcript_26895/g.76085  ORF Transcript_26895/g.76085 Transcript_26895/m.76085 type:complete len:219 (-) Transcript_26895:523-1179(-)
MQHSMLVMLQVPTRIATRMMNAVPALARGPDSCSFTMETSPLSSTDLKVSRTVRFVSIKGAALSLNEFCSSCRLDGPSCSCSSRRRSASEEARLLSKRSMTTSSISGTFSLSWFTWYSSVSTWEPGFLFGSSSMTAFSSFRVEPTMPTALSISFVRPKISWVRTTSSEPSARFWSICHRKSIMGTMPMKESRSLPASVVLRSTAEEHMKLLMPLDARW